MSWDNRMCEECLGHLTTWSFYHKDNVGSTLAFCSLACRLTYETKEADWIKRKRAAIKRGEQFRDYEGGKG